MATDFELIEQRASNLVERARQLIVVSDEGYKEAGEFVMGCKALIKEIRLYHAPIKADTDAAHKRACAMENAHLHKVQQAETIASQSALVYKNEQDRLAREEREATEREALLEAEEKRTAEAEKLAAQGKEEEAEAVLMAPIVTPRPTRMESAVPKVAGLSSRAKWKGEVIDARAVTRAYCKPDESLINIHVDHSFDFKPGQEPTAEQIKSLEDEIGGIRVYKDEKFVGRVKS